MNNSVRISVITASLGAFIGSFCSHFMFTPLETYTCVISAAVIAGMVL